ncbi:MAG TPA: PEP-CTERM sorting domain-containing protein [Verrucomicrobiae bacterium]|nr:PEP-CTERM sorting domain-containing protein [Verrucomicrobiae bacterium]
MTYTVTGGTTTFTKGVMDTLTMSGTITGLAGLSSVSNLLAVSWWTPSAADEKSGGTSPNPIYLHSGTTYVFHPLLPTDLSAENPTGSGSPGFSTNGCVSTCSPADTVTTSASGPYQGSIETLSVAASTPEPASFLLIGAGLIAASIVRKKTHRSDSAR